MNGITVVMVCCNPATMVLWLMVKPDFTLPWLKNLREKMPQD
jgi:hypothetical protein